MRTHSCDYHKIAPQDMLGTSGSSDTSELSRRCRREVGKTRRAPLSEPLMIFSQENDSFSRNACSRSSTLRFRKRSAIGER